MKAIVERANEYAFKDKLASAHLLSLEKDFIIGKQINAYIAGATEQYKIDIDKACEWIRGLYPPIDGCDYTKIAEGMVTKFCKAMGAKYIPVVTKMEQGDPDSLWAKWRTENADKLTISCYADETLSHCSFVAGYRAHEAVANAKKSPLTWQDISRILDLDREVDADIMVGDLPSLNPEEYCEEVLKRFNINN